MTEEIRSVKLCGAIKTGEDYLTKEDKQSLDREINFLKDMISNMLLSDKLSTPYIEDLEKDVAILKKKSHPPIFSEDDYKDIIKRLKKLEKRRK